MTLHSLSRRQLILTGAASSCTLFAIPSIAQDAATTTRTIEDMVMGDPDAPVTVVEYASLTCPHCKNFHEQVFAQVKSEYIETGKVKFEMRDVYFDRGGLWGSMVARCDPSKYFGIIDLLFKRQAEWSRLENPEEMIAAIFAVGRIAGLTDQQMEACVQDRAWAEALVADFQWNMQNDEVTGTPTFFINGVKESNMGYNAFTAKLDAALGS